MSNFIRPQRYITGREYWSSPKPEQNGKSDYLDLEVRSTYANSIIECLSSIYSKNEIFKLHEFGCGWGTNLELIKKEFPNVIITGNDVWIDAIDYIKENRTYVNVVEKDTFDFINESTASGECYDVIITNAHLIHIDDTRLTGLKNLSKICNNAILQEHIKGLEHLVENMTLKEVKKTSLPDSDYRYHFVKKEN